LLFSYGFCLIKLLFRSFYEFGRSVDVIYKEPYNCVIPIFFFLTDGNHWLYLSFYWYFIFNPHYRIVISILLEFCLRQLDLPTIINLFSYPAFSLTILELTHHVFESFDSAILSQPDFWYEFICRDFQEMTGLLCTENWLKCLIKDHQPLKLVLHNIDELSLTVLFESLVYHHVDYVCARCAQSSIEKHVGGHLEEADISLLCMVVDKTIGTPVYYQYRRQVVLDREKSSNRCDESVVFYETFGAENRLPIHVF